MSIYPSNRKIKEGKMKIHQLLPLPSDYKKQNIWITA